MYTSRINPVYCAFTIMFVLFCIICITRFLFPYGADHDVICVGYPNDITLYHSRSNQKKGWYIMYRMNYTLALIPEFVFSIKILNIEQKDISMNKKL